MSARLIRVSSRALGEPVTVRVWVHDTLEEMRAAGERFNGGDNTGAAALTQAMVSVDGHLVRPIIRLARPHLGATVVSHEMHHAATALWGAHCAATGADPSLHHYNEPFAYLYSDLLGSLIRALYRHGYY